MGIISAILVYLMIWMIVFFISLPIGISVSKTHLKGNANSAPINTNLKSKFFGTTLVTLPLTFLIVWVVNNDLIETIINKLNFLNL